MKPSPEFWVTEHKRLCQKLSHSESTSESIERSLRFAAESRLWEKLGHQSFDAWVCADFEDEPSGLGMTVEQLRKIAGAISPALLDVVDEAGRRGRGNPHRDGETGRLTPIVDDVNNRVAPRPTGNSASAALRRLRKDASDEAKPQEVREKAKQLHHEVVSKMRSAHSAALEMGYRKQLEPAEIIEREFAKLSRQQQEQVLDRLGVIFIGEVV